MAQCDEMGKFIPTQCYNPDPDQPEDQPKCWCVDETGHKTQPTVYFNRGERECGRYSTVHYQQLDANSAHTTHIFLYSSLHTYYFYVLPLSFISHFIWILTEEVAVESVVVTLGFRGREAGVKQLGKAKGKEIRDQVSKCPIHSL